jgi:hypothetical protein
MLMLSSMSWRPKGGEAQSKPKAVVRTVASALLLVCFAVGFMPFPFFAMRGAMGGAAGMGGPAPAGGGGPSDAGTGGVVDAGRGGSTAVTGGSPGTGGTTARGGTLNRGGVREAGLP